jgi:hypothetical protein
LAAFNFFVDDHYQPLYVNGISIMLKTLIVRIVVFFTFTLSLFITACSIDPTREQQQTLNSVPIDQLAYADEPLNTGDSTTAAHRYLALARSVHAPAREQLQLRAGELLLRGGDIAAAQRIAQTLTTSTLTTSQQVQAAILRAQLALITGRPEQAIQLLTAMPAMGLPITWQQQRLGLLATAYRLTHQPLAALTTLDRLQAQVNDPQQRKQQQVALLLMLSALDSQSIHDIQQGQRRLNGWLELSQLFAGYHQADAALQQHYALWRRSYSNHPAVEDLPSAYFAALTGGYQPQSDVWVFLPDNGRFQTAAQAIHDGFMTAYQNDHSGQRPQLHFVNSTRHRDIYQYASQHGADVIIGPLRKEAVETVVQQAGKSPQIPTLVLNHPADAMYLPESCVSFALAPEDEAVNAALFAWASGLRSALILYPQGPWGLRIADAFRNQWTQSGGKIAGQEMYGTVSSGFGAAIGELLAHSQGDMVFLVATGTDMVDLWTDLRTMNARSLPVVATSHAYDGAVDQARDRILTGLYFVDIPWMLNKQQARSASTQQLQQVTTQNQGPLARLYAMGIDAYRFGAHLNQLTANSSLMVPGQTGILHVDSRGRVQRQLVLAKFTPNGPILQARITH